jgi:hypothetical protein
MNDESFILKALFLLICAIRMFAIYFPRFQQHHIDLDALLNKIFKPKNMKLKYLSTR